VDVSVSQTNKLEPAEGRAPAVPALEEVYAEFAPFVWRNLRRLGVPADFIEDAVQDVFLVVHRRLPEFEARSSLQTWIFGIVLRVAARQREQLRNRGQRFMPACEGLLESVSSKGKDDPFDRLVQQRAADLLEWVLAELDEDKRTILVMVELEQMSVVECARVLDLNLNTTYTRLRLARRALEAKLKHALGDSGEGA
jgi:RNA polymerase sigma-70 factor (ECF subfamily)